MGISEYYLSISYGHLYDMLEDTVHLRDVLRFKPYLSDVERRDLREIRADIRLMKRALQAHPDRPVTLPLWAMSEQPPPTP